MSHHQHDGKNHALKTVAGGLALLAMPHPAYVATAWYRYGRTAAPVAENDGREGSLIERFMPTYEVTERHRIRVDAPSECVFAAAREMDVNRSGGPTREPRKLATGTVSRLVDLAAARRSWRRPLPGSDSRQTGEQRRH
jgi:hypothetical protein